MVIIIDTPYSGWVFLPAVLYVSENHLKKLISFNFGTVLLKQLVSKNDTIILMKRNKYNDKERVNIVTLHTEKGRTLTSLSSDYGISPSTINRWLTRYRNGAINEQSLSINEDLE